MPLPGADFSSPPRGNELASTSTASSTPFSTPATATVKCKKCIAQSKEGVVLKKATAIYQKELLN